MNGVKGFSRYTLVERDRWLDSPVRRDGRVRADHVAVFRRANEVLHEHRFIDLRRAADVLLMANREYDRLEAASVLVSFPGDFLETPSGFSEYPSFMTVSEATLGFEEPIQMAKSDWFAACFHGLSAGGAAFLLSDTALAPDRWRRYRGARREHVRVPRCVAPGGARALRRGRRQRRPRPAPATAWTASCVPATRWAPPSRRPQGRRSRRPMARPARPIRSAVAASCTSRARRMRPGRWRSSPRSWTSSASAKSDPRLDVTIHLNADDPDRFVFFVANPTAEAIDAEVVPSIGLGSVTENWEGRPVPVLDGVLREPMDPYSIRIYESQR